MEYHGILSQDTFEDIYHRISQTADLSLLPSTEKQTNQLHLALLDKINSLRETDQIDLPQSTRIEEQLVFIEGIGDLPDHSAWITMQSRLLNASNHDDWKRMTDQLNELAFQEQFRTSKANDLIRQWQLNEDRPNSSDKKIIKLLQELAQMTRLYGKSNCP